MAGHAPPPPLSPTLNNSVLCRAAPPLASPAPPPPGPRPPAPAVSLYLQDMYVLMLLPASVVLYCIKAYSGVVAAGVGARLTLSCRWIGRNG